MEDNQKNLSLSPILGSNSQPNEGIFDDKNGKISLNRAILSVNECRELVDDKELRNISDGELGEIIGYLEALSSNIIKIELEKHVQEKQNKKDQKCGG